MRPIKFRAWGTEYKDSECKMRYSDESPDMSSFFTLCVGQCMGEQYSKDIMQFTGLLDKNGKEIYEGDIVELQDTYNQYSDRNKGIVVFENCEFSVDRTLCGTTKGGHLLPLLRSQLEVIGNIYENPELLTNTYGK